MYFKENSDSLNGGLWKKNIYKKNITDQPLFTIITTVLNSENKIEKTIKSVLGQSYSNIEYIIIDAGSSDKTLDVIKKYESKIDYWISEKDKGIYDGFNKGYELARGSYIGIINADDEYYEKAIETINEYIKQDHELDFVFGSVEKHYGLLHGYNRKKIKWSWNFYSSHSTGFFIKTSSAKKIGKYNLKYKYNSDYDFFYRMIVNYDMKGIATKASEVVGKFAPGGYSSKISRLELFKEEINIRLDNKQNLLIVMLLIIYKLINHPKLLIEIFKKKFNF